jgi:hypothetical protein
MPPRLTAAELEPPPPHIAPCFSRDAPLLAAEPGKYGRQPIPLEGWFGGSFPPLVCSEFTGYSTVSDSKFAPFDLYCQNMKLTRSRTTGMED